MSERKSVSPDKNSFQRALSEKNSNHPSISEALLSSWDKGPKSSNPEKVLYVDDYAKYYSFFMNDSNQYHEHFCCLICDHKT